MPTTTTNRRTPPPDHTEEQRLAALEIGNAIRSARARLRKRIEAGELHPGKLVESANYCYAVLPADQRDALLDTEIARFLCWPPGIGRKKAERILSRSGVYASRRIGKLKSKDRKALVDAIKGRGPSLWAKWDRLEREAGE